MYVLYVLHVFVKGTAVGIDQGKVKSQGKHIGAGKGIAIGVGIHMVTSGGKLIGLFRYK